MEEDSRLGLKRILSFPEDTPPQSHAGEAGLLAEGEGIPSGWTGPPRPTPWAFLGALV